ncbi:MAG: hypothetical protein ACI9NY_000288 [Kiritimatiellia bacterium]|jgi:hypothetical protein
MCIVDKRKKSPFLAYIIAFTLVIFAGNNYANSLKSITLQHRDAVEVKAILLPLLPEGSGISVDNNRVLVSAPAALMKNIVSIIKGMDKPLKRLRVSVYRGKYPTKEGVKFATTDTDINHQQTITTLEGQTVVMTEKGLRKITVAEGQYANNSEVVIDPDAPIEEPSVTQIIANNDALEIVPEVVEEGDEDSSLAALALANNTQASAGEVANSSRSELIEVPTGIHLRVTLLGEKQARLSVKVVTAASNKSSVNKSGDNRSSEAIALSSTIETMTNIAMNQWSKLSERNTFSHRPKLGSNRKVHSTKTADDDEQSIWVKIELL